MNTGKIKMISCPACKKEISEQAIQCPGCGHPVRQTLRGVHIRTFLRKISRFVLNALAKIFNVKKSDEDLPAKTIIKNTSKCIVKIGIITVVCICIRAVKAMIEPAPYYYAGESEQQIQFIMQGLLSGLMWWAIMGLTSKFFGRKRLLFALWNLFIFFSIVSIPASQ